MKADISVYQLKQHYHVVVNVNRVLFRLPILKLCDSWENISIQNICIILYYVHKIRIHSHFNHKTLNLHVPWLFYLIIYYVVLGFFLLKVNWNLAKNPRTKEVKSMKYLLICVQHAVLFMKKTVQEANNTILGVNQ